MNLELKPKEKSNKRLDPINLLSEAPKSTLIAAALSFALPPFSGLLLLPLTYSVAQLIMKKEGQTSTTQESTLQSVSNDEEFSVKATQILNQLNLSQLQSLVETIPFSSLPEEFEFPPGHPLPESIYPTFSRSKVKYNI